MKRFLLTLLSLFALLPAFAKADADIEKLRKQFQAEALVRTLGAQ